MSGRRRLLAIVAVVLAGAGIAAVLNLGHRAFPATARASVEDFRVRIEATGKIEAAAKYEIGPPSAQDIWSYNLSWMIPEGSRVRKGDVVARFDATQIEDNLRKYRADLETTIQEREKEKRDLDLSLKQLRLDLVKAEGELQKLQVQAAIPPDLASSVEIQQLNLQKQLAERRRDFLKEKIDFEQDLVRSKLAVLDVKRKFNEGKVAYYEEIKNRFDVKAPVSGLVMYIPKRNGDRWEVGESVWMMAKILQIADLSTLRVEANVLEVDSASVAAGQPAEISVDALPGLSLRSKVAEIGRIIHEKSVQDPTKVFDAYLPLDRAKSEDLRPGMGVKVQIETHHFTDRLSVPLEAVRASSEGTFVEVLGPRGRTEKRAVTLGPRNENRVVVNAGLSEGEQVLLAPSETQTS